jgi:hypothetical protein
MKLINILLISMILSGCSDNIPQVDSPQILTSEIYDTNNDVCAEYYPPHKWYHNGYVLIKVNNPDVSIVLVPYPSGADSLISGKSLMSKYNLVRFVSKDTKIRYIKNDQVLHVKIIAKD